MPNHNDAQYVFAIKQAPDSVCNNSYNFAVEILHINPWQTLCGFVKGVHLVVRIRICKRSEICSD